jgi:hypothetical protein
VFKTGGKKSDIHHEHVRAFPPSIPTYGGEYLSEQKKFRSELGQNETHAFISNLIFILRIMVFRSIKTEVIF